MTRCAEHFRVMAFAQLTYREHRDHLRPDGGAHWVLSEAELYRSVAKNKIPSGQRQLHLPTNDNYTYRLISR